MTGGMVLLCSRMMLCVVDKLSNTEEYLVLADLLAAAVNAVVIVVYQIPNCPVVFRSDPEKLERKEDGLIAWAWRQYMTNLDPKWLPRLPMTKAGMQAMRATEEYLKDKGEINGALNWVVSGASKRGWTSFIVGSARCRTCPRVVGIAPLVPIVPSLLAEVHRQYQSYGGFTFAFDDYKRAGLLPELDNAAFKQAMRLVDPMYYSSRLKSIPKLIVLTSDDEFMQFDWSNIWYDAVLGEKHLLILANSEHSLVTGIPELVPAFQEFVLQVDSQRTVIPIESTYDKSDGSITVAVKSPQRVKRVTMRYAHTLQSKLRDFRWVRLANTKNGECDFPGIKLKKPVYGGGNCIQPIVWLEKHLHEKEGVYRAVPPQPRDGKWVGYYIQVHYESGFQETTPGFVWPDTLPFADCNGRDCSDNLV